MTSLVIIPAYNEQDSIATVIDSLVAIASDFDLVVIDDGSIDKTAKVAKSRGVKVLSLPYNLGVGGAMRLGFKYALKHEYQFAFQFDGDGQHNAADLEKLLIELGSADLVIGSRFAGESGYSMRGPRKWASKLFSFVLSKITKEKITDPTSGFKGYSKKAIKLFANNYPAEYLGDTIEALVIASRSKLKITEIPVTMGERIGGIPSHGPLKSAVYLARATMALAIALSRANIPAEARENK